jgi:signal transduction histidine kinase/CheY-like chemotaxis protein
MDFDANKSNYADIISEREFQKMFDGIGHGFAICELIIDGDGNPKHYKFLRVNKAFEKKTELQISSAIGNTTKQLNPHINQASISKYAKVVKDNKPIRFVEYDPITERTYWVNAHPYVDHKFVVFFKDVTKETKLGEAVKNSEKLYDELFNSMDEMFQIIELIYDDEGRAIDYFYVQVNRAFEELVNKKKEDLIGKRAKEVFAVVEDHWIKTYERVEKTGKSEDYENYGKELDKYYDINAWKIGDGQVAIVFSDITERKLAEKAVLENHRLNTISDMAASIAHDFNNALQNIKGNLDLVKLRNDLPDSVLIRLTSIESTITDVAGRVNALQHFGDIDSGSKNTERISFNEIIAESLKQSRPLWKDKMEREGLIVNIITDYGDIPTIDCNKRELVMAISNLIRNSIDALPQGGEINIRTGLKTEGVFLTFGDSGVGMDEETKLRIFQPFYTTKGFAMGKGLGMSGVYSIVKKYDGEINVKFSELGKGTIIELVFPIGQKEEINVQENTTNVKKTVNVLWVDDDETIRENGCEMLELLGHECDTAHNGKVALECISQKVYDVVITDIGMPEMNGWQLADAIREKNGDSIKIVVVSGWDIDENTKNEHDVNYIIQKPFTMDRISEVITL